MAHKLMIDMDVSVLAVQTAMKLLLEKTGDEITGIIVPDTDAAVIGEILAELKLGIRVYVVKGFPPETWMVFNRSNIVSSGIAFNEL